MRQFITDVSHEFKTPIQVMHAKIDVCQKMSEARNCTAENYMEALQTVKQQTKKLNQLLETLFFLSRVQEGITTFTKEPVNISHYVREKVMQYKEQYGIEIEVHIVS
ncbi:MAG: hypothetical protein H6767_07955 [Candidatus Peribacteria bacterium]|nr:MAG: hypothetical protein H6767_07955 [Candidatus Peribacteria bacterium]